MSSEFDIGDYLDTVIDKYNKDPTHLPFKEWQIQNLSSFGQEVYEKYINLTKKLADAKSKEISIDKEFREVNEKKKDVARELDELYKEERLLLLGECYSCGDYTTGMYCKKCIRDYVG